MRPSYFLSFQDPSIRLSRDCPNWKAGQMEMHYYDSITEHSKGASVGDIFPRQHTGSEV